MSDGLPITHAEVEWLGLRQGLLRPVLLFGDLKLIRYTGRWLYHLVVKGLPLGSLLSEIGYFLLCLEQLTLF